MLAHLARVVVADLGAKSLPREVEAIVLHLGTPVQPAIERGHEPYAMFRDYWKYSWMLAVNEYVSLHDLRESFGDRVVKQAEHKARELVALRGRVFRRKWLGSEQQSNLDSAANRPTGDGLVCGWLGVARPSAAGDTDQGHSKAKATGSQVEFMADDDSAERH